MIKEKRPKKVQKKISKKRQSIFIKELNSSKKLEKLNISAAVRNVRFKHIKKEKEFFEQKNTKIVIKKKHFGKTRDQDRWDYIGSSEVQKFTENPNFETEFIFDFIFEKRQVYLLEVFQVYDQDWRNEYLLGYEIFQLSKIMGNWANMVHLEVCNKKFEKTADVVLKLERVESEFKEASLEINFKGKDLTNFGLIKNRINPILRIYKANSMKKIENVEEEQDEDDLGIGMIRDRFWSKGKISSFFPANNEPGSKSPTKEQQKQFQAKLSMMLDDSFDSASSKSELGEIQEMIKMGSYERGIRVNVVSMETKDTDLGKNGQRSWTKLYETKSPGKKINKKEHKFEPISIPKKVLIDPEEPDSPLKVIHKI